MLAWSGSSRLKADEMASHTFKALLNAASFPFSGRLAHQTVLVPGLDQNIKVPERFYGEISSADFGVPQVIYCENITLLLAKV